MNDDARRRALDAFLGLVAADGYVRVSLRGVAEAAGLEFGDLYRLFADKAALVAGYLAQIDAEVLAGVTPQGDPEETARDRLFDVVMRRYDALKSHRAAWRSIRSAVARDPLLAGGNGLCHRCVRHDHDAIVVRDHNVTPIHQAAGADDRRVHISQSGLNCSFG